MSALTTTTNRLECLERAVVELDVIEAIYGSIYEVESQGGSGEIISNSSSSTSSSNTSFEVYSKEELSLAKNAMKKDGGLAANDPGPLVLDVEIKLPISSKGGATSSTSSSTCMAALRCKLPVGYPQQPVFVTVQVNGVHSNSPHHQKLNSALNKLSAELAVADVEALMELTQTLERQGRETLAAVQQEKHNKHLQKNTVQTCLNVVTATTSTCVISTAPPSPTVGFGRRWIWAHHIVDTDRRKVIVAEARSLDLGGYLKYGYPGIVLIEGRLGACDEYIKWIKGNKSRPGGFGRNWGHHVRGEVTLEMNRFDTKKKGGKEEEQRQESDDHDADADADDSNRKRRLVCS